MTTTHASAEAHPWVEVTERSDGHFLPFVTGVLFFVVTAGAAILVSGLPH